MQLTYRLASYLMAVEGALEEDRVPEQYLTDTCPECENNPTWLDPDGHVVTRKSNAEGQYEVYVVVACEGYWVIDPASVGVDSPDWQDWTKDQLMYVLDTDPNLSTQVAADRLWREITNL